MTNLSTVQKGLNNTIKEEMRMDVIQLLEKAILVARTNGVNKMTLDAAKKTLRNFVNGKAAIEDAERAINMVENNIVPNMSIEKFSELEPLLKAVKAKYYISCTSIVIARGNHGTYLEGEVLASPQGVGRALSMFTTEDKAFVKTGRMSSSVVLKTDFAPFTKDIISVQFKDAPGDLGDAAKDRGIYVMHAGKDTRAFLPVMFKGAEMYDDVEGSEDRLTREELDSLVLEMNGELRLYKGYDYSPSDVRNISLLFVDVTVEDKREEILDAISNGAWEKAKKHVENMKTGVVTKKNGEMFSDADIQLWILKIIPRFGQFKASSVNLGLIHTWVELVGCKNEKGETVDQNFKTAEGETVDGTGYILDTYFAKCLGKILGIKVSAKAVRGMFIQTRPDTMKKGTYIVDKKVIMRMMKTYEGKYEIRGDKSQFPVMLVDQNCIKADSNYRTTDIFLELLEIASCSPANTSMQMLIKALMADSKATTKLVEERMSAAIIKKVEDSLLVDEASIPTPGMVSKMYASDLVKCMAPKMVLQDPALHKQSLSNLMNSCVNASNKLKFAIDGHNTKLTSDISQILAGKLEHQYSVVNYGEIYMPAAYNFFLRKAKTEVLAEVEGKDLTKEEIKALIVDRFNNMDKLVCMIKYPSMGAKEYYLAKVIGYSDVKARVAAMNIEDDSKEAILSFFGSCNKAVSILPASKLVMFQCAGLDYDFDGATFIYDEEFINIIKDQQLEATRIAG